MRIPDKIKIFDQVIRIKWDQEYCEQLQARGVTEYDFNNIILTENYDGRRIPRSLIEKTFFHELSHFIIHIMGYRKLAMDEKFIEQLGVILYNIMLNNNFKEEKRNENKIKP